MYEQTEDRALWAGAVVPSPEPASNPTKREPTTPPEAEDPRSLLQRAEPCVGAEDVWLQAALVHEAHLAECREVELRNLAIQCGFRASSLDATRRMDPEFPADAVVVL